MAKKEVVEAVQTALDMWNKDTGHVWDWGTNYSNVGTEFETFCFKNLFPKIAETFLVDKDLGNRFEWLAREVAQIAQLDEEYTFMDIVPVALNLSKSEELVLKRNYPKIATKLYGQGLVKKVKLTLNNNDMRLNFSTLGDAVAFVTGAYQNLISSINVTEEKEIKSMLVDYAFNKLDANQKRFVTSVDELATEVGVILLNIQNNSEKYNEINTASGGQIGRYTTRTTLDRVLIVTTDKIKAYLLDTKIANTFANEGIDVTGHIISFDDLGGTFRFTSDVTVTQTIVDLFRAYGDYQISVGDILEEGTIITFDATSVITDIEEIKPTSDLFAFVLDTRKIRYRRSTQDMVKEPFRNGEFDEVNHFLHYYAQKNMSPFYNAVAVMGKNV